MTDTWNAKIYSQFLDLRTRPARDLLAAIPEGFEPKLVYDLGSGPGNSTILLQDRWPKARVIGLDSSADMIKEAKSRYPNIQFTLGNIDNFSPSEKIDCIFANASLQWLDAHEILFPELFRSLNKDGVLAIQMPNNFHSPTHQITAELLQNHSEWNEFLTHLRFGILKKPRYHLPWYYDLLDHCGAHNIQMWETKYFQEMSKHEDIFNWVKGTGLRPVFVAMDPENQAEFKKAYLEAVTKAYPFQANGKVLLPFKRIFLVGFNRIIQGRSSRFSGNS